MKRIAFISWDMSILGGVNQVVVTLANNLCHEYDVYIVSLVKSLGETQYTLDSKVHNIEYVMSGNCRGRELLLRGRTKLQNIIKKNGIDIVFLMGFQVSLPAILMIGKNKCKYVFCDHEALMSRWNEKKITLVRYLTAKMSDKVITLTEQNAKDYQKRFKLSKEKVGFIYNSISEKILENRGDYNSDSKIILSVGRFSPEKGYDYLVEIAEKVLKQHSDWKWYIYGNGETFSDIQGRIETKHLKDRIILKGEVSDVSKIYGQAALFVLTSKREGLPLVLLEAKANHLPCVSFDIVSGPREIIRDEIDGILIPPYDKEKMADAIEELISNQQLRKNMSLRADESLDKFSNEQIMRKWGTLIENL